MITPPICLTASAMLFLPRIRTIVALASIVGGPYVATQTDFGRGAVAKVTQLMPEGVGSGNFGAATLTSTYGAHSQHDVEQLRRANPTRFRYDDDTARRLGAIPEQAEQVPQLVGTTIHDIREIIRFDITPEWVIQRFSRVSTVLADLRMEGLRVPIVTGIKADDLAGTLTYYFDPSGKVQRISIHGFTGDPSRLVTTMVEHYGLTPQPSLEAAVLTRRWNGVPVHFLRLSRAPVVYSDAVHQKYTVFIELNEPNLAFGISAEAQRIVDVDRHSGRW